MADNMEQVVQQIVTLLGQLEPGDAQAIVAKLAKEMGGEQQEPEAAPMAQGTVSPEGGVAGVPVK